MQMAVFSQSYFPVLFGNRILPRSSFFSFFFECVKKGKEKAEIDEHTRNAQAIIDADKRRKAERQAVAMSDDNSGLRRGK